jgi:hypothetical protein
MKFYAKFIRFFPKLRFKLLRLATIKDIQTDYFHTITEELLLSGWEKTYEYQGFDAWIDYGQITLKKGFVKLNLEWDNWSEGSFEGPSNIIRLIAKKHGLKAIKRWRWSDYDDM